MIKLFKRIIAGLRGDKAIWALVTLLGLFSFMPVFSASSNLSLVVKNGTVYSHFFKHFMHISIGIGIVYIVSKIKYERLKYIIYLLVPAVIGLLVFALLNETVIAGANASRWVRLPFVNLTFQPSALAIVVLNMYIAHYMSKNISSNIPFNFKKSLLWLWGPIGVCTILILPANLSTAALLLFTNVLLIYLGGYPFRYLLRIGLMGFSALALLYALGQVYPNKYTSRMATWESRIDRFLADEDDKDVDNYQTDNAKIAIATGGVTGLGPGKSVQRNFLPQSSSDFIFAIIVEEFGMLGALGLIFTYLSLFVRFFINATKITEPFGKLLIYGLGFPIVFQAFVNMGVAVQLFPTTGQSLPLISSGGTSIWITCAAIGVILSVTAEVKKSKVSNPNSNEKDKKTKISDQQFEPTDAQVTEAIKVVQQN